MYTSVSFPWSLSVQQIDRTTRALGHIFRLKEEIACFLEHLETSILKNLELPFPTHDPKTIELRPAKNDHTRFVLDSQPSPLNESFLLCALGFQIVRVFEHWGGVNRNVGWT